MPRERASDEYEAILGLIPGDFSDPADSLPEIRAKFDIVHYQDVGPDVSVVPDRHGLWVKPDHQVDDRMMLWVHSGGFVTSPGDACAFWGGFVARHCGIPTLLVDYSLAPEATFPTQVGELADAHDALLDRGTDPQRIVFGGDSCGGGMAVAAMLHQRQRGCPQPAAFVGMGGWYDLLAADTTGPGHDPFVNLDWLRLRARDYVGPFGDPADPLASVVNADLSGLPPMLLQTGEVDACLPGAETLALNARQVGVDVVMDVTPGVAQGFQGMTGVPEAAAAWVATRRFIDSHAPSA
jgi:monoterpene epsilon-lactone hydrolase